MKMDRARRCFAGAITAPAGREAATPRGFSAGAAAVPTGCGFCFGCGPAFVCAESDVSLCLVLCVGTGSFAPVCAALGWTVFDAGACAELGDCGSDRGCGNGVGAAAANGLAKNIARQPAICFRTSQNGRVIGSPNLASVATYNLLPIRFCHILRAPGLQLRRVGFSNLRPLHKIIGQMPIEASHCLSARCKEPE